ncbi:hypothetical protein [Moraxella lacunata]|uniref:hypothetical protein n=1 Tax=Moraxella lacunata TaxID=477 RepID=UPI003EE1F723
MMYHALKTFNHQNGMSSYRSNGDGLGGGGVTVTSSSTLGWSVRSKPVGVM